MEKVDRLLGLNNTKMVSINNSWYKLDKNIIGYKGAGLYLGKVVDNNLVLVHKISENCIELSKQALLMLIKKDKISLSFIDTEELMHQLEDTFTLIVSCYEAKAIEEEQVEFEVAYTLFRLRHNETY